MALHVAAMIRNEADRFLAPALETWSRFADELLVLNDGSTDDSAEICKSFGAYVVDVEGGRVAWGEESPKRARLFDLAWATARLDDYILILDADMTPARSPRGLMESEADAISFALFDLWSLSPLTYREDDFWRGHLHPRVWMVRKTSHDREWTWSSRGIHVGHLPLNFTATSLIYAPRDHSLLHYAYSTPELRDAKYVAYASVAAQLSDHELAHARSIRDAAPATFPLDFVPEYAF